MRRYVVWERTVVQLKRRTPTKGSPVSLRQFRQRSMLLGLSSAVPDFVLPVEEHCTLDPLSLNFWFCLLVFKKNSFSHGSIHFTFSKLGDLYQHADSFSSQHLVTLKKLRYCLRSIVQSIKTMRKKNRSELRISCPPALDKTAKAPVYYII